MIGDLRLVESGIEEEDWRGRIRSKFKVRLASVRLGWVG